MLIFQKTVTVSLLFSIFQTLTAAIIDYVLVKSLWSKDWNKNCVIQMFLGIIPTLSKKGFFARYYGGCKLYDSLDDRPGSSTYPISLAVSLIFQVSLFCFKKIQQRKLTIDLVSKKTQGCFPFENKALLYIYKYL